MSDPHFQSMHLESLSRREQFRLARARVVSACGEATLTGKIPVLLPDLVGDGPPSDSACIPTTTYWVQDGDCMHALSLGVNGIGRLPDNAVVIRDECVSRRHCAITVHSDGSCQLHDVASKNGTIINGRKITGPTRLKDGDKIELCSRTIIFHARTSRKASS